MRLAIQSPCARHVKLAVTVQRSADPHRQIACLEALEGEKREPSPTVLRIRSDDLMLDVLSIGVLLLLLVVTVPVFHTKNLMARV